MQVNTKNPMNLLSIFFDWWFQELVSVLPTTFAKRFSRSTNITIVKASENGLLIDGKALGSALNNQQKAQNGVYEAELILDGALVLEQRIPLPKAVSGEAEQILHLQADKYLPFGKSGSYWGLERLAGESNSDAEWYALACTSTRRTDELLRQLLDTGVFVQSVVSENSCVQLRIPKVDARKRIKKLAVFGLVVAVCVSLATIPIARLKKFEEIDELNATQLRALVAETREASQMRRDLDARVETLELLDRYRTSDTFLTALESISELLPKESYLTELAFDEGELRIAGLAPNAADLVVELQQTGAFQDLRLENVSRDRSRETERFQIRMIVPTEETLIGRKGGGVE